MNWTDSFPIIPMAIATISIVQPSIALAEISEQDMAAISKEVTVIINGQNPGSGVIVAKEGNTYWVLTAKHVVPRPDEYEIVTSDAQSHPLNYSQVKKLPEVDLALVPFTSTTQYRPAVMGNSDTATEGEVAYIAGWPHPGRAITQRVFQFTTGQISGRPLGSSLEDGYELIYTNITRSGMSGGPVFDSDGVLVGIHGRAEGEPIYNPDTGETVDIKSGFNLGISINTFFQKAAELDLRLSYSWLRYYAHRDLVVERDSNLRGEYNQSAISAAITPDGQTLVAGYRDGQIRLWELSTGELQQTLNAGDHRYRIINLALTPDGKTLVSQAYFVNQSHLEIRVWDFLTGTLKHTFPVKGAIALSPNGQFLATDSAYNEMQVLALDSGQVQQTLKINNEVMHFAFTLDGQQLAIATNRGVHLWDWQKAEQLRRFENLPYPGQRFITCIATSPDGQTLAGQYVFQDFNFDKEETGVALWDVQTGELLHDFPWPQMPGCWSLDFSPSGQILAHVGRFLETEESEISVLNLQTGARFFYPEAWNTAIFSPDGQTFVTGRVARDNPFGEAYLTIWQAHPLLAD